MAQRGAQWPKGYHVGRCRVFYQIKDILPDTFPTDTQLLHEEIQLGISSDTDITSIPIFRFKAAADPGTWTEEELRQKVDSDGNPTGSTIRYNTITIKSQPTGKGPENAGHYEVSCLTPDTLIKTPLGDKPIKDIQKGDDVICDNGLIDKVIFNDVMSHKTKPLYYIYSFSDGSSLKIVNDHRIYSIEDKKYKKLSQFAIGEHTYNHLNEAIALTAVKTIHQTTEHCTIWTANYNSYYANNILCGNRFANIKWKFWRKFIIFGFKCLVKLRIIR